MSFDLFARTIDNRFIFHLFEFLLSGVISLVILRAWRRGPVNPAFANHSCLLPASVLLSASLGYSTVWTGAHFFFHAEVPELAVSLASHICLTGAWVLLGLQFLPGSAVSLSRWWGLAAGLLTLSLGCVLLGPGAEAFLERAARVLDATGLVILAATIHLILRSRHPARRIVTAGLWLFGIAGILHLGSGEVVSFPVSAGELWFWNLEQLMFSAGLLLLALAIGEMSTDLFDIVFIRIQIAFILLAGVIILVVTRTEQSEYLMELRSRSRDLAKFVVASLEFSAQRGETFSSALEREDLLTRVTTDFGNLPELAAVHVAAANQAAAFAISPTGEIRKTLSDVATDRPFPELLNEDRYFLLGSFSLRWPPANESKVQLYGAKEYFDRYSRKRTVLIFSLFTGAVALATLMIGFVVHHAERTLRKKDEEIRAKQEELLMASKLAMLGELAGSVAHEVNNPATTIMSRSSFLLKKWKGENVSSDDRQDMAVILEQARRIAQITVSLLGFSRKHVFEINRVSVCEVIEKSVSLLEDDLRASSVEVTVRGCTSSPPVWGDRNSLVQVFVNLLRNSIDAMPSGGCVSIEVGPSLDRSSLRIRFSDTGGGIPEKDLSRIFVPFFTTKRAGKGTGLGLSVVHGIISEHKGAIRVESRRGEGAIFHIELPCGG